MHDFRSLNGTVVLGEMDRAETVCEWVLLVSQDVGAYTVDEPDFQVSRIDWCSWLEGKDC